MVDFALTVSYGACAATLSVQHFVRLCVLTVVFSCRRDEFPRTGWSRFSGRATCEFV